MEQDLVALEDLRYEEDPPGEWELLELVASRFAWEHAMERD